MSAEVPSNMVRVLTEAELGLKTARKAGIEQLVRLNDDVPHHFLLRSDIVPKTNVLELVVPEALRVYAGPFVAPYQLVFSVCAASSVILSLIDRSDDVVDLMKVGWVSPVDSRKAYDRIIAKQRPVVIQDLRVLRARHPYGP